MNDEKFTTMAKTAALSFMEIQRQLAEVADNVEKMFRQNEEGFSAAKCGVCILVTAAEKNGMSVVLGSHSAIKMMADNLDEIKKDLIGGGGNS